MAIVCIKKCYVKGKLYHQGDKIAEGSVPKNKMAGNFMDAETGRVLSFEKEQPAAYEPRTATERLEIAEIDAYHHNQIRAAKKRIGVDEKTDLNDLEGEQLLDLLSELKQMKAAKDAE